MKRIGYTSLATAALVLGLVSAAFAGDGRTCPGYTPSPNGAAVTTRVFNDCPTSVLTVTNNYPSLVEFLDDQLDCFGFANLHLWKFSETGGATKADFENCSFYSFCADVTVSGTGNGEAGLSIAPWWFEGDGRFMINSASGEIACFGGRLPFYSFTAAQGLTYVKGSTVKMQMVYNPHSLSAGDPATIEYFITIGATTYSSGPLAFDMANPAEDPPHGLYGALYPHSAGGYFQPRAGDGTGTPLNCTGSFANICFSNLGATPTQPKSWGTLKTMYR